MSAERLVEFILTKHHSYLWGALPEAHELIVNVLKAHGRRHPEPVSYTHLRYKRGCGAA